MTLPKRRKVDIFRERKQIHVEIPTDIHTQMRMKLFLYGLTPQEAFEAFSVLIALGDHRVLKMLDATVNNKIRKEIDRLTLTSKKTTLNAMNELDSEQLYSLINENAAIEAKKTSQVAIEVQNTNDDKKDE